MVTDVERAVDADRVERLPRWLLTNGEVADLTWDTDNGLEPRPAPGLDELADEHENVPQTSEEAHTPPLSFSGGRLIKAA